MTKHSTPPVRIHASGFTLTEVVVALGLFVFAITALMGIIINLKILTFAWAG